VLDVTEELARSAGDLADRHGLRGYDALHLASALTLSEDTLVATWGAALSRAARSEGCAVAPADR